jgi:hypothetical protein
MNLSLIIIEKLKAYIGLSDKDFISLADFARVLDKEDFCFLGNNSSQQGNADVVKKEYQSKYYFSYLANSLSSRNEVTWNPEINQERSLDKVYAETLENADLNRKEQPFVTKWLNEQKELDLSILHEPRQNIAFLETSCTPSFYQDLDQPWAKIAISASEMVSLDKLAQSKYPANIYSQVDPILNGEKLDVTAISFEIKLVSILRNWFDRSLLENGNWKTVDNDKLSNGLNSNEGKLPAYPSSMIFIKNVIWDLAPGTPNNVAALKKVQDGSLNMGSIPIQGIPQGTNLQQVGKIYSANLKPAQLQIFNQNIQKGVISGEAIHVNTVSPALSKIVNLNSLNNTEPQTPLRIVDLSAKTTAGKVVPVNVNATNINSTVNTKISGNLSGAFSKLTVLSRSLEEPATRGIEPASQKPLYFRNDLKILLQNRDYFRYYPWLYQNARPADTNFSVSGYVRTKSNNAPIPGALITVLFGEGKRLTTTTDQNGWYTINNISKGDIALQISKADFQVAAENLTLNANLNRDFSLSALTTLVTPGSFLLFGLLNTRLPVLPNPIANGEFVDQAQAIEIA